MPTMTTSPSLCLKTLMKTTIPFSSCKCTRFISLWLRPFPIYVPVLLLQTLCLMSSYHVEHYGHAKRIVRNGDSFPANIWYHNTTKALPKFDIPDPVKYGEWKEAHVHLLCDKFFIHFRVVLVLWLLVFSHFR
eukprot:m.132627 g.132627  ORF g.132627 m.132627 type:complete len:133 (-) comp13092_c0_seq6:490-888(-)